jgi:hypothetical protein
MIASMLVRAVVLVGATMAHALCFPSTFHAQHVGASIRLSKDRPLGTGNALAPVVEPHLSAHPTDPGLLFVSALVMKAARPYYDIDCALFVSKDRGINWSRTDMGFGMCGNPWSIVLPDRSLHFVALTEPAGIVRYRADMRVYHSVDSGTTWSTRPHEFGPGFDYPKIVDDAVHGDLYVIGTRAWRAGPGIRHAVVVARSADGGRTFADSVHLTPSEHSYEAQVPVLLGDGTLLIPFTEHHSMSGAELQTRRSWVLVSRDRGRSFSGPRLIAEGCGGGGAGWPYLAASGSDGPYRNRIYWLCTRQNVPGVWLQYSDDVGATWSEKLRVDREGTSSAAVAYAMAVNREGTIGVMWLSRKDGSDPCSRLVFAASLDGGKSFLQPVQVPTEESCPARDTRNSAAHAHRPRAGGDYNGLAAAADGSFHLVWADARDGIYRLRHATAVVERPQTPRRPARSPAGR